jgi:hypothetical protein
MNKPPYPITGGAMDSFNEFLDKVFPVQGGAFAIQLVTRQDESGYFLDDAGQVILTLRVIYWEGEAPYRSILDIREQDVSLCHLDHVENDERFESFVSAWVEVASEVLERPANLGRVNPEDLFRGSHPLDLKTAREQADFAQALRVKSRLGRYLT